MPTNQHRTRGINATRGRRRRGLLAIPAQNQEPYRIWFEFLKLALKDPELTVDKIFYEEWGNVENVEFEDWWEEHWENLFAVEIGVYQIKNYGKLNADRHNEIIVRLPLYRNIRETLGRVREILEDLDAGERLADMRQGKFRFNTGQEKEQSAINATLSNTHFLNLNRHLSELLGYYTFWVNNSDREGSEREKKTFIDYHHALEEKRRLGKRDRNGDPIHIPTGLSDYIQFLEYQERGQAGQLGFNYDSMLIAI